MHWGLLGPESIASTRRVRTLGVGAAVRAFNDLAVPGMGGVWYGKQLLLACLGIGLAEKVGGISKISAANAVEATACWLAFQETKWTSDARLRGRQKLSGKDFTKFDTVRRPGFYVTQPMRMAAVQPLVALGLVKSQGERFNSFELSEEGWAFIEAGSEKERRSKSYVLNKLVARAKNEDINTPPRLRLALSPLRPMSKRAANILHERLHTGPGSDKRGSALKWMAAIAKDRTNPITWDERPALINAKHWDDLRAGALFFAVRDAAIDWLNTIEAYIRQSTERQLDLSEAFAKQLLEAGETLKRSALEFLALNLDPSTDNSAQQLCLICALPDPIERMKKLVLRDGRVLELRGNKVVPGAAFRWTADRLAEDDGNDSTDGADLGIQPAWPQHISSRVKNFYLLNLDLEGQLDAALKGE